MPWLFEFALDFALETAIGAKGEMVALADGLAGGEVVGEELAEVLTGEVGVMVVIDIEEVLVGGVVSGEGGEECGEGEGEELEIDGEWFGVVATGKEAVDVPEHDPEAVVEAGELGGGGGGEAGDGRGGVLGVGLGPTILVFENADFFVMVVGLEFGLELVAVVDFDTITVEGDVEVGADVVGVEGFGGDVGEDGLGELAAVVVGVVAGGCIGEDEGDVEVGVGVVGTAAVGAGEEADGYLGVAEDTLL